MDRGAVEERVIFRLVSIAPAASALVLALLAGCNEAGDGQADAGAGHCAPGLTPEGAACVPIFDACQDDEVPRPGGGCLRVGVRQCAGGLMAPPKWACKAAGPPATCLTGWARTAGGWCEPVLPKSSCPAGTMAQLGQATCQPVGDCGSGTWGKLKRSGSTLHVDQGHQGTSGKGTQAAPFLTITAALAQATAGDHIVVAAGTYKENLSVLRKVTLEGRCAQQVIIAGSGSYPAMWFKHWASGALLRGVTITGASTGLQVDGVAATAERVVVQGCEGRGVRVAAGGTLTLRRSLVAGNRTVGLSAESAKVTVERSVVRDTRARASDSGFGIGIQISMQQGKSQSSELTLRHSLVSGNRTTGLRVSSSRATVEFSVVRDTLEQTADKKFGHGIDVSLGTGQSRGSELTLRDSVVAGNLAAGIMVESSKATMERAVVRDTKAQVSNGKYGVGIQGSVRAGQSRGSELTLLDSLVRANRTGGISLASSRATIERSVIRETLAQASDKTFGVGIQATVQPGQSQGSELTLKDSVVADNRSVGILLGSSRATVERSVVRDTRAQPADKKYGQGFEVTVQTGQAKGSELTLRDSLVVGNRSTGIVLVSSRATVERSVVRDTRQQEADNKFGLGIEVSAKAGLSQGSELTLRDSVVAKNRATGIAVVGSQATVERSVVRDTQEQAADHKYGAGIQVSAQPGQGRGSVLTLRHGLVQGNRTAGIIMSGSRATVERSVVRDTRKNGEGLYGDGVSAKGKATLQIQDSVVERSARAGLLFDNAGGSLQRCLIRHNVFAVDLEHGAAPVIGDDNQLVNNQLNKVTTGQGLEVPPVPTAPDPLGTP